MRGGVCRSSVVVGRRAELDHLRRQMSAAVSGQSACIFLIGEGGVGKTRLLNEAILEGRRGGLAVLVGRAAIGAPLSFGVIAEALRSHLRGDSTATVPPVYDAGLQLVLPEWPRRSGASGLSDSQLRLLAHEGIVTLVREVATERGLLLVVDDLHSADAETLEALRYLGSASIQGVLMVVASRRHESALADRLVDTLTREGLAETVPIEGLDTAEVADLLSAILDSRPPTELVAEVVARTDGVPLFIEEVVDAHLRAGSLVVDDMGVSWRGGASIVPGTVAALVATRLDRLTLDQRDALIAGAVCGLDDVDLVAEVSGRSVDAVHAALRAAVDAGLVESIGGNFDFRHAIVGDAMREQVLPDGVRALHARAAEVLGGRGADDDTTLERRAAHLAAAGEQDSAASVLLDAVGVVLRGHALLRAEALARTARQWAQSPRTIDAADDALASVLAAQGRWSDALTLDEATVARSGYSAERWMRMARCALDGRLLDVARALSNDVAAIAVDSPFFEVTTGRLALVDGDADRALRCAQRVLEAGRENPVTVCEAFDLRARALDFLGRRDEAAAAWTDGAACAETAGLTAERLRLLLSLAELELFSGRPPIGMTEVVDVARHAGAIVEEAWAQFNLSIALAMQGDPAAGLRAAGAAVELCRDHRLDLLPYALMGYAGALMLLGDPTFEAILDDAHALAGDSVDAVIHAHGIRGDHLLHVGRYDEAIPHLDAVTRAIVAAPGGLPASLPYWLPIALRVVGRDADARHALALAHGLPNLLRWRSTPLVRDVAEALLAGDATAVDEMLGATAGHSPFEVALLHVMAAEILPGSSARARWLRTALDVYDSTGGALASDRVRGLLRDTGAPVPRRRRKELVPPELIKLGVTARETEVLALVEEGLSNAAIAEQLFVSIRTVESHVSALLNKLGATSRADLARAARSRG